MSKMSDFVLKITIFQKKTRFDPLEQVKEKNTFYTPKNCENILHFHFENRKAHLVECFKQFV